MFWATTAMYDDSMFLQIMQNTYILKTIRTSCLQINKTRLIARYAQAVTNLGSVS